MADSVYVLLAQVMAEVDHVAKRDFNDHQRFNFRGIDSVLNAVGPALRKYKVIVAPTVEDVTFSTVQTSGGKPATACRVTVKYTFYGPNGDWLTCSVVGEAWDSGDKAAPKAMSVAFRTALLQSLALPTDEPDPDSHTYERAEPSRPNREAPPIRQLQAQVWNRSKEREPNLSDDDRRTYIAGELVALGGGRDNPDTLTQLLKEWA